MSSAVTGTRAVKNAWDRTCPAPSAGGSPGGKTGRTSARLPIEHWSATFHMIHRTRTRRIAALALFAAIGLVSALAPAIASPNMARAHSRAAQTLSATFSSTVYSSTV